MVESFAGRTSEFLKGKGTTGCKLPGRSSSARFMMISCISRTDEYRDVPDISVHHNQHSVYAIKYSLLLLFAFPLLQFHHHSSFALPSSLATRRSVRIQSPIRSAGFLEALMRARIYVEISSSAHCAKEYQRSSNRSTPVKKSAAGDYR